MTAATVSAMIAEARQNIGNLSPDEVQDRLGRPGVVLVDLREPQERALRGAIPGALHVPRGMLEFNADAATPYYMAEFQPNADVVLYCASGGRSALAGAVLKQMGFERVSHLDGGFGAWVDSGHQVEDVE